MWRLWKSVVIILLISLITVLFDNIGNSSSFEEIENSLDDIVIMETEFDIGKDDSALDPDYISSLDRTSDKTDVSIETKKESYSPSIPTRLVIPKLGINHKIFEYTDEMVAKSGSVKPKAMNDVVWWSGGGMPGTSLENTSDTEKINFTTYLYGHSTNNDKRKVIFDDIDLLESGDEITIFTKSGNFIYSVSEVFILKKKDLMADVRVNEDTSGRLLLISCWRSWSGSGHTTENVVVVANLLEYKS